MLLNCPTVVELFARRVETGGSGPALAIKRGGEYQWLNWDGVAADVWRLTAALVAAGVKPQDRVAQISENRYEWIICDLAIQLARAVHVPIHPTLAGPQIAWQLNHSRPRVVFLSGPQQAAKLAAVAEQLPSDLSWYSFDPVNQRLARHEVGSFALLCHGGSETGGHRL